MYYAKPIFDIMIYFPYFMMSWLTFWWCYVFADVKTFLKTTESIVPQNASYWTQFIFHEIHVAVEQGVNGRWHYKIGQGI